MAAAPPLVLALDVGTTGVRAMLVDERGVVPARAYREMLPTHPAPGRVEHDTEELLEAAVAVIGRVVDGVTPGRVRGLGMSVQRATAVVWDAASGRAVHPALSWQDNRTKERCEALLGEGLLVSPLTAASKIEWILDRVDPDRAGVRAGRLRCGTLDAWLAWRLSGGRISATDASQASCSGLWDFLGRQWAGPILQALRIPEAALPQVEDSSRVLGPLDERLGLPPIPLAAIIGDQQAAAMGHLRLAPGELKVSYGTAAMVVLNAGPEVLWSSRGAYPLVLWQRDGVPTFCLEGMVITAGAAVTWLRDGLGVIRDPGETTALAASVPDTAGAWCVPAFQGLGTPYLDSRARAVLGGLTRATTRAHVVRAVLEGIAWRCRQVCDALRADSPHPAPATLRVGGGAARNDVLLQVQADTLGIAVERPSTLDAAGQGAAYLAGLATGVWRDTAELTGTWHRERLFEPRLDAAEREARFAAWQAHVSATREDA